MNLTNKAGIYIYTFPNGKKYVGQSVNLKERLKQYRANVRGSGKDPNRPVILAIRKYGWENVKIEYPFTINRASIDELDLSIILDVLEVRYIRDLETATPKGYNLTNGADSTLFTPIISNDIVGKTIDKTNYKPVLLYDKDGNFISEYESISDCAYQLHLDVDEVRKYANCRKYMRGMYIVKYKKGDIIPNKIVPYSVKYKEIVKTITKEVIVEVEKPMHIWRCHRVPILQYSLDGNFMNEYESISAASRALGGANISLKNKTSAGYIWIKKESDDIMQNINPVSFITPKKRMSAKKSNYESKFSKGIIQSDLNGNKIASFDSIIEASSTTNIPYRRIYAILTGKIKNPDYLWTVAG